MPSDLEQRAKELADKCLNYGGDAMGFATSGVDEAKAYREMLAALREADSAAERRTAERCAEIANGKYAGAAVAEAIRAEFLGGSKP